MPRGKKPKVTPRDRDALDVISKFWGSHGRAPTLREIGVGLGTTHGVANTHVKALLAAGELERNGDGDLVTPGQKNSPPSLARVVGTTVDEWIPAPEPGLVAWRADCDAHGIERGDLVFFRLGDVYNRDLVIIQGDGGAPRVHVVTERVTRKKHPLADTIKLATGETVDALPVEWLLRKVSKRG